MTEDEALAYAAASIRSVWALEMLLTLKRAPERVWSIDALIRELRSSLAVVNECLSNLHNAGLITEDGEEPWPAMEKSAVAARLAHRIAEHFARSGAAQARAVHWTEVLFL